MDLFFALRNKLCLLIGIFAVSSSALGPGEGQILSPGYPSPYESNVAWTKKISVESGHVIHFTVHEMDIPSDDYLVLKDGSNCDKIVDFNIELAKFETRIDPAALPFTVFGTMRSGCLYLDRFQGGGKFNITYKAVPQCTGNVPYLEGNIISPNYPHSEYYSKADCRWTLSVSKGQTVKFQLADLGIESKKDCSADYLQITGLDRKVYPQGKVRLCGKIEDQQVKVFESVNNEVDVQLITDWFSTHKGFWLKYEVLGCKHWDLVIKDTPVPPRLKNPATNYRFGYLALFECPRGYAFESGVKQLPFVCQGNRTWSGRREKCKEIECGDPGIPASGWATFTNGERFESVVTYSCKNGSTLIGETTRTCEGNGMWNRSLPSCQGLERKECGDPGDPAHGYQLNENNTVDGISSQRSYPFGSVIRYACDVGYYLADGGNRTCTSNGTWSGAPIKCNVVMCPNNLTSPENGTVVLPLNTEYGAVVTYTCDHGFERTNGSETRQCLADGTWNGQALLCRKLSCSLPQKPWHGDLAIYDDIHTGTLGVFTCDAGYVLKGENTTICTDEGTWTNPTPICEAISCVGLTNRNYTNVTLHDYQGEKLGNTARYICKDGYFFNREFTITKQNVTCLANKKWSKVISGCPYTTITIVMCPNNLTSPENGTVVLPLNTEYGAVVTYTCDHGFERTNGSETRQCLADGTWSGQAPLCRKLSCSLPQKPWHGELAIYDDIHTGTLGVFTCDAGYVLKGENTTICTDEGTWTNPTPICEAVSCVGLVKQNYTNVTLHDYQGQKLGNTARYICKDGYFFNREFTITKQVVICLANKKWSMVISGCPYTTITTDTSRQTGNEGTKIGMYVGIAIAGLAFLIILALIAAYFVRRGTPKPAKKDNNFDNPMYNVNANGVGQVIMGEGWSPNPTYEDSNSAAENRESTYDVPRVSPRAIDDSVYGNINTNNSFSRIPEVVEDDDK